MAGFVIIIGMLCVGICYLYGSMKGEEAVEKEKLDEVEKVCTTSRDAYEASRLIAQFMKPRRWVCRMDVCYYEKKRPEGITQKMWMADEEEPKGWSEDGIGFHECTFIRLCHYLGCEVIVRQVGSDFGTDETMYKQIKTSMRASFRRKKMSLIIPYKMEKGTLYMDIFGFLVTFILYMFTWHMFVFAFRLGYGPFQTKWAKRFHANTSLPPKDDAVTSSQDVISFLYRRCEELNLNTDERGLRRALDNVTPKLEEWIRVFHACGCELVIRKVADSDIGENLQDLYLFQNEVDIKRKQRYKKNKRLPAHLQVK